MKLQLHVIFAVRDQHPCPPSKMVAKLMEINRRGWLGGQQEAVETFQETAMTVLEALCKEVSLGNTSKTSGRIMVIGADICGMCGFVFLLG